MSTYYNETFEGVTPPALPANWSTLTGAGTIVTSSTVAHAGSNSLKITPAAANNAYAWNTAVDTNNGYTVIDGWFYVPSAAGTFLDLNMFLRSQTNPSSNHWGQCYAVSLNVYGSSDAGSIVIYYANGTGTATALLTHNPTGFKALFSTATWYRMVFQARDFAGDGGAAGIRFGVGIQRGSDGKWLVAGASSDSWVDTGVVTFVAYFKSIAITNVYLSSGFAGVGNYGQNSGQSVYWDDVKFSDYAAPPNIRSLPTWTPGNSAELQGTYISVDAGSSALSNISDNDTTTNYVSTALYESWAGLDLGSGNTATLTRVLVSPFWQTVGSVNSGEWFSQFGLVEGANAASTGPWTQLGTLCQETVNRLAYVPCPITAGSAYRYFRVHYPDCTCALSELRFEGQLGAGSPTWQPVRPALSPAAGKFANGSTVTMTTPTSGASIYYTIDGSTPTTGSTLYSGAITLPSNAVTTVKAIAYHASGTTTTSAVTTGIFTCPLQHIPDTGVTGYGTINNWSEDQYDDMGLPAILYYPTLHFEGSTLYVVGQNFNTPNNANSLPTSLPFWVYSSTDWYNFHYEFNFGCPPSNATWRDGSGNWLGAYGRPHFFVNPSPVDPNKKYLVATQNSSGGVTFITAPAWAGPWKWTSSVNPIYAGDTAKDTSLFLDPQTGLLWYVYSNNNTAIKAIQLDSTTDYTTVTGAPITLDSTGSREGQIVFFRTDSYYLVDSYLTGFGEGNSRMKYKAIQGASLSAVASAMNAATYSTFWASGASSPAVAYNAQSCDIVQVPGRKGFLMSFNLCDPGESPETLSHMRPVFWPLPWSAVTTGATPSINATPPTSWNFNGSLPSSGSVAPFIIMTEKGG